MRPAPETQLERFGATGLPALPVVGTVQRNKKLEDSPITWCPEVEGVEPCKFMAGADNSESPLCPGCWAAKLWKVRNANWGDAQVTDLRGLIRLGNWREITETDWLRFKAGEGVRRDGRPWQRPDFARRPYFLVTRGLEPWSFYERVLADPLCLNVQVSVDVIHVEGGSLTQVPGDDRLRQFLAHPKAIFRLKTLAQPRRHRGVAYAPNVQAMLELARRLALPSMRTLETPLRLGDHSYGSATPLEQAGQDPTSFLRCNTACRDCPSSRQRAGENRVLACAATPAVIRMLERVGNVQPPRQPRLPMPKVPWAKLVAAALQELGGEAHLQDLYRTVARLQPEACRNPLWQLKVRQVVQRIGTRVAPGRWRSILSYREEANGVVPAVAQATVPGASCERRSIRA